MICMTLYDIVYVFKCTIAFNVRMIGGSSSLPMIPTDRVPPFSQYMYEIVF
jgi:hypothetical protein